MNKRIKIFAGALAAVLALSASVAYALSAGCSEMRPHG